ncbi:XRE family transcriptional regulator [Pseudoscardovia radai]|uniref:XRE family transcriptional regulator n=1 Tax=Pseudoscardovia radai TaxID=987066 RepID=A0A261F2M9_9BIFI|nr:helix-turn-helix transcriptional regulator [Pseudoscardovia radai]OZG53325.1 XRE family transcriptional regulator [Pseudoscardovia radai]
MTGTYEATKTKAAQMHQGTQMREGIQSGATLGASQQQRSQMTRELTPEQRRAVAMRRQQILLAQKNRMLKAEREQARSVWERQEREDAPAPHAAAPVKQPVPGETMFSLRKIQGEVLRELRTSDHKTLREVSEKAGVSLGYLSEVERGQKEASSELLVSITDALGVRLSQVLTMIAQRVEQVENAQGRPDLHAHEDHQVQAYDAA